MCYFIILACKAAHQRSLLPLLKDYRLTAIAHCQSLHAYHPQDVAFWLTDGFCACSLYGFSHSQHPRTQTRGISRSLLQCFENQLSIHRLSLWVQWGDTLPKTLTAPVKLSLTEAITQPDIIHVNQLYDLQCII